MRLPGHVLVALLAAVPVLAAPAVPAAAVSKPTGCEADAGLHSKQLYRSKRILTDDERLFGHIRLWVGTRRQSRDTPRIPSYCVDLLVVPEMTRFRPGHTASVTSEKQTQNVRGRATTGIWATYSSETLVGKRVRVEHHLQGGKLSAFTFLWTDFPDVVD